MIVAASPSLRQIVREVWRPLALLFCWDCAVAVLYDVVPWRAPSLPLPLFGSALALFLGFRVNAAYARWWEARVLWGAIINTARSLSRVTRAWLPPDIARTIVRRQIGWAHALRGQLRRAAPDADGLRFVPADDPARARTNVANALLDATGVEVAAARATGRIDSVQQAAIETLLVDAANAQGGCERLKNTPLPIQYRFLPTIFTQGFCVLLPIGLVETLGYATPLGSTVAGLMFLAVLRVGDDLADPFAGDVHDVPLSAMCRTIEIDLLQGLGEEAPGPLGPVKGVLW